MLFTYLIIKRLFAIHIEILTYLSKPMEHTALIGDVLCFAYGITLSNIRFVRGNVELRQQYFPCLDTSFQMNVFILIIHYVVMDSIRNQSTH